MKNNNIKMCTTLICTFVLGIQNNCSATMENINISMEITFDNEILKNKILDNDTLDNDLYRELNDNLLINNNLSTDFIRDKSKISKAKKFNII